MLFTYALHPFTLVTLLSLSIKLFIIAFLAHGGIFLQRIQIFYSYLCAFAQHKLLFKLCICNSKNCFYMISTLARSSEFYIMIRFTSTADFSCDESWFLTDLLSWLIAALPEGTFSTVFCRG